MLDSFRRPDARPLNFKTDYELHHIIDNREKYLPESVLGAMSELKNRGTVFSDEEVRVVEEDMQARKEIANTTSTFGGLFSDNYKNGLVEDPEAYDFYSKRAIKAFTFFFGAFFGSVMMAMNIAKTQNQRGVLLVLLFGIGLTVIEGIIGLNYSGGSALTFIFAFINMSMMDGLFWNKYIGKNAMYRPRKYWIPLIIGLAIYGALIVLIIASGTFPH